MLQERAPLYGATVELVQSLTIALLVGFLAVAVLCAAVLGFAWTKAKIAAEKLRTWYAEIATRRVMNDARRSQRLERPAPDTLRSGPPLQPMRPSNTPQPPPLPTIPINAPPRPRSKPLSAAVELAQTSPDWSDDRRKTQRAGSPPAPPAPAFDLHSSKTQRMPRPRPGAEVTPDELDLSDFEPDAPDEPDE